MIRARISVIHGFAVSVSDVELQDDQELLGVLVEAVEVYHPAICRWTAGPLQSKEKRGRQLFLPGSIEPVGQIVVLDHDE